jgi:hypothetical protein
VVPSLGGVIFGVGPVGDVYEGTLYFEDSSALRLVEDRFIGDSVLMSSYTSSCEDGKYKLKYTVTLPTGTRMDLPFDRSYPQVPKQTSILSAVLIGILIIPVGAAWASVTAERFPPGV